MSLEEAIQRWRDVKSDLALALAAQNHAAVALRKANEALGEAGRAVQLERMLLDEAIESAGLARGGER